MLCCKAAINNHQLKLMGLIKTVLSEAVVEIV